MFPVYLGTARSIASRRRFSSLSLGVQGRQGVGEAKKVRAAIGLGLERRAERIRFARCLEQHRDVHAVERRCGWLDRRPCLCVARRQGFIGAGLPGFSAPSAGLPARPALAH
jgi:hypothetical protein